MVDKVRASRDGHEFHETWTARLALKLLDPDSDLIAIAVEGLSPNDQAQASSSAAEIADLTLYYGVSPNFREASRVEIIQFKYSVANADADFRSKDTEKTIRKFASSYTEHRGTHGAKLVSEKLEFRIVTNQPLSQALLDAIDALARAQQGTKGNREFERVKAQANLAGQKQKEFFSKLKLVGYRNNLASEKARLASLLADWSASRDALARARLGTLKALVREKAGGAGEARNLITRTDLLAALGLETSEELLPCAPAITSVSKVVERSQLPDLTELAVTARLPVLIHAAGGVGKTVFMTSLAQRLSDEHEVVLFDCFGGGRYRSPGDARHLAERGLVHIANTLAFRGLCDPLLPGSRDSHTLIRTFLRRVSHCTAILSTRSPSRHLVLIIDAIDNAEFIARQRGERSFAIQLVEALHSAQISRFHIITSCRTERIPTTFAEFTQIALSPFTLSETMAYLQLRRPHLSTDDVGIAQARSGGNPRVLAHLFQSGRLFEKTAIHQPITLEGLLKDQIADAFSVARERGATDEEIQLFLTGLALLPPPVPLQEHAQACNIQPGAIESFSADLSELFERTQQGLTFRDEPTETFIVQQYASTPSDLPRKIAENLGSRQQESVYAAQALPALLNTLNDGERLYSLAFDNDTPKTLTSKIGKLSIRRARITAAIRYFTKARSYNEIFQLLLELTTVTSPDDRGVQYITDHPDLVVATGDAEAIRRLSNSPTNWPGTRYARLTIVNVLSGNSEEVSRYYRTARDWVAHHLSNSRAQQSSHEDRPEQPDIAALSLALVAGNQPLEAHRVLSWWHAWYAYEVCVNLLRYLDMGLSVGFIARAHVTTFIESSSGIGALGAVLSFANIDGPLQKGLVVRMSRECRASANLRLRESDFFDRWNSRLQDGLRVAASIASTLNLPDHARAISLRAPHARPKLYVFRTFSDIGPDGVFGFIFRTALLCAGRRQPPHEKDLLPVELYSACSHIRKNLSGPAFREKVSKVINGLKQDEQEEGKRFIQHCLTPLLELTEALVPLLSPSTETRSSDFGNLLHAWIRSIDTPNPYSSHQRTPFFTSIGLQAAILVLSVHRDIETSCIRQFADVVNGQNLDAELLVEVVGVLGRLNEGAHMAGEQATRTRASILKNSDMSVRTKLLARLAEKMLHVSLDEASEYFRFGLEQMDSVGSGDSHFVTELLGVAAATDGQELQASVHHQLSNICELSLGDEPDKFDWATYGVGMGRVAGTMGLAKLSRWDDRSQVSLHSTLLPYLTGLISCKKLSPLDAMALNRLAAPVERWDCGTSEFASAVLSNLEEGASQALRDIVQQYFDENRNCLHPGTLDTLASLANETGDSDLKDMLGEIRDHSRRVLDIYNEQSNYHPSPLNAAEGGYPGGRRKDEDYEAMAADIAAATDPCLEEALANSISKCNELPDPYLVLPVYFAELRRKLSFGDRLQYIRNLCRLEVLELGPKLQELEECKRQWGSSSAALETALRDETLRFLRLHAHDMIRYGTLWKSGLRKISALSSISRVDLAMELIEAYSKDVYPADASIWLSLAAIICERTDEGRGQDGLVRLLRGPVADLCNSVADGSWRRSLYPENDTTQILSSLIWRSLGESHVASRWRAAHCLRQFARYHRWEVVNAVVARIFDKTGGPFCADELVFYSFHARLWSLIALARIAVDHPVQVASYVDSLLPIALGRQGTHALMQHFAARSLLLCIDNGALGLSGDTVDELRNVGVSSYRATQPSKLGRMGFYDGRPKHAPPPRSTFTLEYEFGKIDVSALSRVFDKSYWEVEEMLAEEVHAIDPSVTSMYDSGGRERHGNRGGSSQSHGYGEYLGWHALFIVAGRLLRDHPVAENGFVPDPWSDWVSRHLLTREDGLWLSDGRDDQPIETIENLLEKGESGLEVTGQCSKILKLIQPNGRAEQEIVVFGRWHSADGVKVEISSALASSAKAHDLADRLIKDKPSSAWIQHRNHDGDDDDDLPYRHRDLQYEPWITRASPETALDGTDPYAAPHLSDRVRICRDMLHRFSLESYDPFSRTWLDTSGNTVMHAESWYCHRSIGNREPCEGERLLCSRSLLQTILSELDKELVILIKLERYHEGYGSPSTWDHTVAVIRIDSSLSVNYLPGRQNYTQALFD